MSVDLHITNEQGEAGFRRRQAASAAAAAAAAAAHICLTFTLGRTVRSLWGRVRRRAAAGRGAVKGGTEPKDQRGVRRRSTEPDWQPSGAKQAARQREAALGPRSVWQTRTRTAGLPSKTGYCDSWRASGEGQGRASFHEYHRGVKMIECRSSGFR